MNVIEPALAPTPDEVLNDPTRSAWLKSAVRGLLARDPREAFEDAVELRNTMERRYGDEVAQDGS